MQILLDTHILLWALADDPTLSDEARFLLCDGRNQLWVSAVSIWEISIKHALGRGDMPLSGRDALGYCR
jgi:PIN domain nuclease of toxin-antitoxin system